MMHPDHPFHAGELAAQQRAGGGPPGHGIREAMADQHRAFFSALPYAVLAGLDLEGRPTATVISGPPGFIAAPDPLTLLISTHLPEDEPIAEHLVPAAPYALLGLDFATRRRNRANGRVAAANPVGYRLVVDQSFGNCPKYIHARRAEPLERAPGPLEPLGRIDEAARALVTGADTFFTATAAIGPNGGLDVSHRGGRPGFVNCEGDTLTVPDFRGNRYFNTLGNMLNWPRAAALFPNFETGELLLLQGQVEVLWDADAAATGFSGAQRMWRLRVEAGWRRCAALPFRWTHLSDSPALEGTGRWASAPA